MLLTPHIVRTHQLTKADLEPIYIGTQQHFGLTGPAPTIESQPSGTPGGTPPAGSAAAAGPETPVEPTPNPPPGPPTGTNIGSAQVVLTPPGTQFTVGGGPYTVPVSVTSAVRLSTVTFTVRYNPAVLRVQGVQEGSFMRQGGTDVTFTHQVDAAGGRIDVTLTRAADSTGASGTGLLAAVLFDAIAPGSSTLAPSGIATGPGGTPVTLQLAPATITVK